MKQLLKKFQSVIFLLIATLFFGNAVSGFANATNAATAGPLFLETTVSNLTDHTDYLKKVNAKAGDELALSMYIRNTTTDTLKDLKAQVQLDNSLEYVAGSTAIEAKTNVETKLPDGITAANGITLPNDFEYYQNAYLYFRVKVKAGATGVINPTATISYQTYNVTDSAQITFGADNQEVAPKLDVDTKAINLGNRSENNTFPTSGWQDSVTAKAGDTVAFYVFTLNDQPAGVNSKLKAAKVKAELAPLAGENKRKMVGTAWADNASAKANDLTITTSDNNKMNFVSGSGRLYWHDAQGELMSISLPDSIMTSGVNLGDISAGGEATGKTVYFQMRVADEKGGTILFDKHAFVGTEWVQGENPARVVEFVITLPDGTERKITTGANGQAEMTGLPFGNYKVRETVPTGFEQVELTPANGMFTLSESNAVQKVVAQNKQKVVVTPTPTPTPSVTPTPTPTPSVTPTPTPTPTPSVTPTPTPTPSFTPTPSPSPKVPALQIAKYVGNANKNEATDKTSTKAVAGDVLNWRVVIKNVGTETIRNLRTNDVLPANVRVTTDFVITRDGNRFKLIDFTRQAATIGDLAPGKEVTIEFGTAISRDVACGNELVNTAYAEADNHGKIRSEAKAKIECVTVAGTQQPLVKTGSSELALSMILSMLSVAGYYYQRQRKQVAKLFHSF